MGDEPAYVENPWTVEVYHGGTFGAAMTSRFFFADEPTARSVYDTIKSARADYEDRKNDRLHSIEISDVFGSGEFNVSGLFGVRVVNRATMTDWNVRMAAEERAALTPQMVSDGSQVEP